jgi:PAS domain S-box-containing protein
MPLDHQPELAARLKQLFERTPGLVVLLSGPEHVITYANAAYLALVGDRAVVGRPIAEAIPELAEQGFVALLDQVYATGEPYRAEAARTRLAGADGRLRERFFDFVYQPVLDDRDVVVGVFAQVADVTDRVRAENAVRDREARLELAARAADLGIWDLNLETGEILFDARARAIWGLPEAGPITDDLMRDVLHPDDLEDVNDRFRRAIDPRVRDGSPYEYRLLLPGGRMRWVRAHAMAIFEERDGAEVAVRYLGTMADVTEERRREEALKASEGRLRLALDAGRMAVWAIDQNGKIQVTPEFNRILRLPEDARPTLEELQSRYYPGELERLQKASQEILGRGGRYMELEYRHLWPDDTVRWLLVRAEFQMNDAGEAVGAIGVVMDVTERRESEERLLLLAREVDHRANNLLAIVHAAIRMTTAADVPSYKDALLGRVSALAHAHQLLASSRWLSADLRSLVGEELKAFCDDSDCCTVDGPPVRLSPATAQALALAFHELVTNAVKYGALSVPGGCVSVTWTAPSDVDATVITWQELGGPPVVAPTRRGMGSRVLERALGGNVGGRTEMEWRPEGLVCRLFLGEHSVAAAGERAVPTRAG